MSGNVAKYKILNTTCVTHVTSSNVNRQNGKHPSITNVQLWKRPRWIVGSEKVHDSKHYNLALLLASNKDEKNRKIYRHNSEFLWFLLYKMSEYIKWQELQCQIFLRVDKSKSQEILVWETIMSSKLYFWLWAYKALFSNNVQSSWHDKTNLYENIRTQSLLQ